MNSYKKILLSPFASIREAIEIIDSGAMKIALVTDESHVLLGTLTDGDIRRAFLNGRVLDDSIEDIYFRMPVTCGANDSREKIIQLAVTHKIYQIPVLDSEGKIIGVADVDEFLGPVRKNNKVVLMAGGLGTRLSPLTDVKPKPMLHVGNKPILETIIENFAKYGFSDFLISVNYKSHMIEEYFGNGDRHGVKIEYVHESKRLGTAGALSLMKTKLDQPFFVMNGDLLTDVNFEHMHSYHVSHDADATMAVREYDFQVPYGVVNVLNGRISSIEEKPVHKFFVSAGIYMLSPNVLQDIPENDFFDMPTLFEMLIQGGRDTVSFPIREYWLDIGRVCDYEKANAEYSQVFE